MRKPASFYFFKRKPIVQKSRHEFWREVVNLTSLSIQERLRVEWMVFYYTVGKENAALTAHCEASAPGNTWKTQGGL